MRVRPVLLLAATVALVAAAPPGPPGRLATPSVETARGLREQGLRDDVGYELLRSLTTEVGARFAGTPEDARAVAWALGRLKALGFVNVRAESVKVPRWIRGTARVDITSPWPQPLVAAALGGSVASPAGGIEAEVVGVTSIDELKALPRERVAGRVVFFNRRMEANRDASGYGPVVAARGTGAAEAAKLGAVAMVMRSAGTSRNRIAHTGSMRLADGVPPIPALALSNPDADLLERQLGSGRPVRLSITSTSAWAESTWSANVIGEIPGRMRPAEIVVLGAHLDSWDLGTGAHDDGAGVAIVTAAARLIGALPTPPRRTIRVVLYANEEFGLSGARAYVRRHAATLGRHVLGMESDLGAFRVYGMAARVSQEYLPLVHQIHGVLEPLGIVFLGNEASGGADVGQLREAGVPVIDLRTDAIPYFELHHTANDTFDKVDPELLRLNVAAYAVVAYLAAESADGLGRLPLPKKQ